jgi:hypothetical protein
MPIKHSVAVYLLLVQAIFGQSTTTISAVQTTAPPVPTTTNAPSTPSPTTTSIATTVTNTRTSSSTTTASRTSTIPVNPLQSSKSNVPVPTGTGTGTIPAPNTQANPQPLTAWAIASIAIGSLFVVLGIGAWVVYRFKSSKKSGDSLININQGGAGKHLPQKGTAEELMNKSGGVFASQKPAIVPVPKLAAGDVIEHYEVSAAAPGQHQQDYQGYYTQNGNYDPQYYQQGQYYQDGQYYQANQYYYQDGQYYAADPQYYQDGSQSQVAESFYSDQTNQNSWVQQADQSNPGYYNTPGPSDSSKPGE